MQQADATAREPERPGSEEQLRAVRAAIDEHFEALLRDAHVFAHSLRVPGDRDSAAQDALQAAVETAIRVAGQYDPSRPAYPWLRKLVFNAVRTYRLRAIRQRDRNPSLTEAAAQAARQQRESGEDVSGLSDDELLGRLGARTEGPEVEADSEVNAALSVLSPVQQQILHLRFRDGLSAAEVAAQLGCSEGAVHTRVSRAKDRLRQVILANRTVES